MEKINYIKVTELANKMGVKYPAICQWRKAGKIPAGRVPKVAELLNKTTDEIFQNPNLLFDKLKRPNKERK